MRGCCSIFVQNRNQIKYIYALISKVSLASGNGHPLTSIFHDEHENFLNATSQNNKMVGRLEFAFLKYGGFERFSLVFQIYFSLLFSG